MIKFNLQYFADDAPTTTKKVWIGNNLLSSAYVGTSKLSKIYVGNILVYEASSEWKRKDESSYLDISLSWYYDGEGGYDPAQNPTMYAETKSSVEDWYGVVLFPLSLDINSHGAWFQAYDGVRSFVTEGGNGYEIIEELYFTSRTESPVDMLILSPSAVEAHSAELEYDNVDLDTFNSLKQDALEWIKLYQEDFE